MAREENLAAFLAGNHPDVPHVAYHGSNKDVNKFNTKLGAWFSENPALANEYASKNDGNVYPVHLSIKNPINFLHAEQRKSVGEVISHALNGVRNLEPNQIEKAQALIGELRQTHGDQPKELFEFWRNDPNIAELFRTLGYDGISAFERADRKAKTWAALNPEQIKSATGNNGNFDPAEKDINKADGGPVIEKYHGTDVNNLTAFDPSKSRTAKYHYLADQPETAQNYGEHVYSVKLKPKNMISFHPENIGPKQSKVVNELAERLGEDPEHLMSALTSADGSFYGGRGSLQDNVMDELKDMGYDAVRFPDVAHGGSWDMSTVVLDNNIVDNIEKYAGEPTKADGGSVDDGDEGLTVYHGSPHDFEQFDTSKIGTGEGAQAYGRGLYFSESEPVATEYRDRLTDKTANFRVGNIDMPKWILRSIESAEDKNAAIEKHKQDFSKRIAEDEAERETSTQPWMVSSRISTAKDILAGLDQLQQGAPAPHTKGRMYEVRINAHPDHFLHWNKPLSEQSEYVKGALSDRAGLFEPGMPYNGQKLYQIFEDMHGNDAAKASQELANVGIKGIKYFANASGEGPHNYVVFNHDHVQVKRKYAEGGAVEDDDGLTAYHGSPHDFEKFDTSQIGTGEGAQAYGHGLYFAEAEPVAQEYRDKLTAGTYKTNTGAVLDPFSDLEHMNVRVAAYKSLDNAIDRAKGLLEDQPENADMINRDLAKLMEAKAQEAAPRTGHMYEVRIKAHPDHFLDWDVPFEKQHANIQNIVRDYANQRGISDASLKTWRGEQIYENLGGGKKSKETSEMLHNAGIPGIKYLDEGSRSYGEGTRNYVVFNHDNVEVKKKYADGGEIDKVKKAKGGSVQTKSVDVSHPNFQSWFGKSVAHDDGVPRKFYTGTSKDVDFPNFKVGRHGVWFTTDPSVASSYAKENDSQGFRRDGWDVKPTNTASRVIPTYLKAENPYVGELPDFAMKDNYKKSQSDWFDTLRMQGYDSWIPQSQQGNLAVILQHPGQIKSAISNTEAYDPAQSRIDRADGGQINADDIPSIDNPISVFPKPQRMYSDEDRVPGGQYLDAKTKADLTGKKAAMASIGINPGGKPYFNASPDDVDETGSPGRGSAITKANLFKQKAGWKWLQAPEGHEDTSTVVSVAHRGDHHYALNAHFPKGVDFARYENASSEPRLRPTTRGNIIKGDQVGSISVRGKEHPVYDHIIVKAAGGAVDSKYNGLANHKNSKSIVDKALMLTSRKA